MPPEPTISFTLPSLHDKTVLSCRVYHPLLRPMTARRRRAAVFAHPYAPLGGCYDDVVVGEAVDALLGGGYVVGTFSFRGAAGSGGRTSWTAKPERADYMTVAGFMAHYMYHLEHQPDHDQPPPLLLLGGYSYGAMVTTQLPPMEEVLEPFVRPALCSPAAEVRLRAQHLGEHQRAVTTQHPRLLPGETSPRRSLGMRVGGSEVEEEAARRSFSLEAEEKLHRGLGDVLARTRVASGGKWKIKSEAQDAGSENERLQDVHLALPKVAYLLVSPLQGIISHLATMSILPSAPTALSRLPWRSRSQHGHKEEADENTSAAQEPNPAELKLIRNPTLAVFGDTDIFVSAHKLRSWASRMESAQGSCFQSVEVVTAGHFWVEKGVMERLVRAVMEFSRGLADE